MRDPDRTVLNEPADVRAVPEVCDETRVSAVNAQHIEPCPQVLELVLMSPRARDSNWTPSLAPELGDGPLVTGVSSTVFSCRHTTVGAAFLEAEHRTEISK